eukprot:Clim_evm35s149 gene=Clim_evmTU35s149
MGVKGLFKYVRNSGLGERDVQPISLDRVSTALEKLGQGKPIIEYGDDNGRFVVIDGPSLVFHLYFNSPTTRIAIDNQYGSGYNAFAIEITAFFLLLVGLGLKPWVIMDGPADRAKYRTQKERQADVVSDIWKSLHEQQSERPDSRNNRFGGRKVLPPLAMTVFRRQLHDLGVWTSIVVDGEADAYVATLAQAWKASIWSNDSDYFILPQDPDGGYFPLTMVSMPNPPLFTVKGEHSLEISGKWADRVSNGPMVHAMRYRREQIAKHLKLPSPEHLLLFATLAGNDYISNRELQHLWLGKRPPTDHGQRFAAVAELINSELPSKTLEGSIRRLQDHLTKYPQLLGLVQQSMAQYRAELEPYHRPTGQLKRQITDTGQASSVQELIARRCDHAEIELSAGLYTSGVLFCYCFYEDLRVPSCYNASRMLRRFAVGVTRPDPDSDDPDVMEVVRKDNRCVGEVSLEPLPLHLDGVRVYMVDQLRNGRLQRDESIPFKLTLSTLLSQNPEEPAPMEDAEHLLDAAKGDWDWALVAAVLIFYVRHHDLARPGQFPLSGLWYVLEATAGKGIVPKQRDCGQFYRTLHAHRNASRLTACFLSTYLLLESLGLPLRSVLHPKQILGYGYHSLSGDRRHRCSKCAERAQKAANSNNALWSLFVDHLGGRVWDDCTAASDHNKGNSAGGFQSASRGRRQRWYGSNESSKAPSTQSTQAKSRKKQTTNASKNHFAILADE